jgi:hypothetical protein
MRMMKKLVMILCLGHMACVAVLGQGTLIPPSRAFGTGGTPIATMKTMDQIEPRRAAPPGQFRREFLGDTKV